MIFICPKVIVRRNDEYYERIGEKGGYLMLWVRSGIACDSLSFVDKMEYGSVTLIGLSGNACVSDQFQLEPDLNGCISSIGDKINWGIEYDESGVLTFVSRDVDVIKNHAFRLADKILIESLDAS